MRPDMAKVVTERPRRGHSNPSLKTAYRLNKDEFDADDHGAMRAPVSRRRQHGWDAKDFSDLLGPLRRYLHKQVGRPWNEVFSELSQTLDRRSISGSHIWDHVFGFVTVDTVLRNGKVYESPRWGWNSVAGLYVHPTNGLLLSAPERRYRYKKPTDPNTVVLTTMAELKKVEGIWFRIEYKMVPTYRTHWTAIEGYVKVRGKDEKKIALKKQLSSKELRAHGLRNEGG